MLITAGL